MDKQEVSNSFIILLVIMLFTLIVCGVALAIVNTPNVKCTELGFDGNKIGTDICYYDLGINPSGSHDYCEMDLKWGVRAIEWCKDSNIQEVWLYD